MIGFLKGDVLAKNSDSVILLTNGVGYLVFLPLTDLTRLKKGEAQEFYIYTQVKAENLDLYGFKTAEELSLFKILLNVSGIGAKTALNIIDRGVQPVRNAVAQADVDFFQSIPRLGRKNAQRIIIELKNKIGGTAELDLSGESLDAQQITEALQTMGYSKAEVGQAIRKLPDSLQTIEEKIRFVLQELGRKAD